jgi:hypothetical protein
MEILGILIQEGDCELQYKLCCTCGFAVRLVLRRLPDPTRAADLRKILQTAFARNVPERVRATSDGQVPVLAPFEPQGIVQGKSPHALDGPWPSSLARQECLRFL